MSSKRSQKHTTTRRKISTKIQTSQNSQRQVTKLILRKNLNGVHLQEKRCQKKIGASTRVSLKKATQLFGESMKKDSGKNTMHVYVQMEKMESMIKQKNLKNSPIYSYT